MTILFELGRESELAFLELEAVLTRYKLRPVLVSPGWATLTIQEMSHPGLMTFVKKLQFQLGGVRQIWLVIGTKVPAAKIYPLITNWWHGHYPSDHKVSYGISQRTGFLPGFERKLEAALKPHFPSQRYIRPAVDNELSGGQIWQNKLDAARSNGRGLVWRVRWHVPATREADVAVLLTTQDLASFTLRDREPPVSDGENGLLPVKLAQTLVNIAAGQYKQPMVVDPFCGNGRVLIEAARLGFRAFGTEVQPQNIAAVLENAAWWKEQSPESAPIGAVQSDATNPITLRILGSQNHRGSIVVCTEPWLGTPARSRFTPEKYMIWSKEVEPLYFAFLRTWKDSDKQNVKAILLTVPVPIAHDGKTFTGFLEHVVDLAQKMGYHAQDCGRYARPDACIGRAFIRLTREARTSVN